MMNLGPVAPWRVLRTGSRSCARSERADHPEKERTADSDVRKGRSQGEGSARALRRILAERSTIAGGRIAVIVKVVPSLRVRQTCLDSRSCLDQRNLNTFQELRRLAASLWRARSSHPR